MIDKQTPIYIKQIPIGPMENFVYFVGDKEAREIFVVDPAWNVGAILEEAKKEGVAVKGALVTHAHFDHTNSLEALLERTGGVAYVHKKEAPYLKGLKGNFKMVEDGDKVKIGNLEITCLHTPGHTAGSQCFFVEGHLFTGDTLFLNAAGRCDLPGGSEEQLEKSLKRLAALDEDIIVYPGHNYGDAPTSTIGQEKRSNPYLQFAK